MKLFVIAALLFFVSARSAGAVEIVDRVVAVVNGEMLTLFDVEEQVKQIREKIEAQNGKKLPLEAADDLRRKMLDRMVDDILIHQEAVKLKVTITDVEIENQIRDFKEKNNLTEENFLNLLALQKMSRREYADKMKRELLKNRILSYLVKRKVVVTDEEVRAFLAKNPSAGSGAAAPSGKVVQLEVIMLDSKDKGDKLRQAIVGNQISFADAARKYSVGPAADKGGDLGVLPVKDLGEALQKVIPGLKDGEISPVFKVEDKETIIRVKAAAGGVQSGAPVSASEDVRRRLQEVKFEEYYLDFVKRLRAKAVLKISL